VDWKSRCDALCAVFDGGFPSTLMLVTLSENDSTIEMELTGPSDAYISSQKLDPHLFH
jgi:hypothetical protein